MLLSEALPQPIHWNLKDLWIGTLKSLAYQQQAKPRLGFIQPRFNPWVMRFSYAVLPLLLRVRLRRWLPARIWPVTCQNPAPLLECLHQFHTNKIRLILAFRHSQVDDPLCLSYLFSRILPQAARELGMPLQLPVHSYFMYDRGMPLWAGSWLGWFFSRMGGTPVRRGRRLDLKALKTAREYLVNGQFPFTIAPEGATNGHGEIISPLEPGTAQIAFWGVQDLQELGRAQRMLLLPVGLRYFYPRPDWAALDRLMSRLEADSGLAISAFKSPATTPATDYLQRLRRLGAHLLNRMEQFYQRFYRGQLTEMPLEASSNPTDAIAQRLHHALEEALCVGERFFGLPSTGSIISRCRRLEEAGWSYIYREDIGPPEQQPPMERGLANWIAQEASLHMRHMRLVESFVAVTGNYVQERPSFERLAETSLIMFDLVERVKGTEVPRRPCLGQRHGVITLGEPIDVTRRWPDYAESRQSAKVAVETLSSDLQQAMEKLVRMAETDA